MTKAARALPILALLLALGAPPRMQAQGTRPGGTTRGSSNITGRSSTQRSVTSGGTGRSTSGARQYRSNTELGDATITIDPETRSLVIVSDEDTHRELFKVIQSLDQIKPQVLIKVVFVEVTYNKGSDIGVEGSYTFNQKSAIPATTGSSVTTNTSTSPTGSATNPGTSTTNSTLTTPLGVAASLASTAQLQSIFGLASATDGTFVRLITDDWSATLRAMATRGKVEVLSRPSIMARNNQEAVIVVGQEVPFVTNSRTDNNGNLNNTITYDNIGIILRVTPFITSEGTVEMIVAPEISNLTDQTVPIGNNFSAPVISKRSAETVVVTPNGQTVVIGGLMETQRIESIRKVPILGDIPLIGLAFKRTIKDDVKRELLIFLTPHIVNTASGLKQLTKRELEQATLIENAFSRKEYEQYLEPPPLFAEPDLPEGKEIRRATTVERTTTTTERTTAPIPVSSKPRILSPVQPSELNGAPR